MVESRILIVIHTCYTESTCSSTIRAPQVRKMQATECLQQRLQAIHPYTSSEWAFNFCAIPSDWAFNCCLFRSLSLHLYEITSRLWYRYRASQTLHQLPVFAAPEGSSQPLSPTGFVLHCASIIHLVGCRTQRDPSRWTATILHIDGPKTYMNRFVSLVSLGSPSVRANQHCIFPPIVYAMTF